MTTAMAKTCLEQGIAVTYDGRRYHRINAIIYRKYYGNERNIKPPRTLVELYDGYSNSVMHAPIEDVDIIMAARTEEAQ